MSATAILGSSEASDRTIYVSTFGQQSDIAADTMMLKFFIGTLQVRANLIAPHVQDEPYKNVLDEINKGLAHAYNHENLAKCAGDWSVARKFERMLALLEPNDTLVHEVQRRIAEATEEHVPTAARLQKTFDEIMKDAVDKSQTPAKLTGPAESNLRALLQDTMEDAHRFRERIFCIRPIKRVAVNRIIIAEIISFTLMILPYVYLYSRILFFKSYPDFEWWAGLPLYSALTTGLFGAFFSRMQSLQSNWNNLSLGQVRDATHWRSIVFRGTIGMGGALIVYFFLQSGLVSGDLFPKFDTFGVQHFFPSQINPVDLAEYAKLSADDKAKIFHLLQPNQSLSRLVIWSFIAGFSERLVPGILAATETSIGSATSVQRK